jgi:hypothetical protein
MAMAPDPRKSFYCYICGIKGSGKSEYAKHMFYSYPYDRLVVDVTHDVTEELRKDGIPHHQLTVPIAGSWPEWVRDPETEQRQMTLVFRPDMGDENAFDDMDRCVGLCMRGKDPSTSRTRPVLVWLDEIGDMTTAHKTGPGMRRALGHGRHHDLSMLMCGPEAKNINPKCISQADRVVVFQMMNRDHREAIARNTGVDQDEFDTLNKQLAEYEHMVWERDTREWTHMAPLPRWRRGRNVYPELVP